MRAAGALALAWYVGWGLWLARGLRESLENLSHFQRDDLPVLYDQAVDANRATVIALVAAAIGAAHALAAIGAANRPLLLARAWWLTLAVSCIAAAGLGDLCGGFFLGPLFALPSIVTSAASAYRSSRAGTPQLNVPAG